MGKNGSYPVLKRYHTFACVRQMEAAGSSETIVTIYQNIWHHIRGKRILNFTKYSELEGSINIKN